MGIGWDLGSIRWMPPGLQTVDAGVGQFWEPKLDALATEIARGKRERRRVPMARRTGKRA